MADEPYLPAEITDNCLNLENEPNRPEFVPDSLPHLIIGITAIISTIWPMLTMAGNVKFGVGTTATEISATS